MYLQWITTNQCSSLIIGYVKMYKLKYPIVLLCLIIKYYADLLVWMNENDEIQIPRKLFCNQILYNNKISMPYTFIFNKNSSHLILLKLVFELKKLHNQEESILCINLSFDHYDSNVKQMVHVDGWHRILITFNKLRIKAINNSSVTFPALSKFMECISKKKIFINCTMKCEFFSYKSLA